jgi:hypothetical protein
MEEAKLDYALADTGDLHPDDSGDLKKLYYVPAFANRERPLDDRFQYYKQPFGDGGGMTGDGRFTPLK